MEYGVKWDAIQNIRGTTELTLRNSEGRKSFKFNTDPKNAVEDELDQCRDTCVNGASRNFRTESRRSGGYQPR